MIYLTTNTLILVSSLFEGLLLDNYQMRTAGTISVIFLWFKVFDWLRLFDGTAFFTKLITETLWSIRDFVIVLLVWYFMFGTAFYIINMNRLEGNDVVPDIFNFWALDAFIVLYELSLGEFQTDAY